MTESELRELLHQWCSSDASNASGFAEIKSLSDFLQLVLFHEYEPTDIGAHGTFAQRLARWIGNTQREDLQQALFFLLGHLVFFGRKQMRAGYYTAFSKNILVWLLELEGLSFFGADTEEKLKAAVEKTAFTEITDSFRLGDFIRWNNLHSQSYRYSWSQHLSAWNEDQFRVDVMQHDTSTGMFGKQYLVLLEDFVGSGSQMARAARYACNLPENFPILFCPIIICPDGAQMARSLENAYAHFRFSPVLELPEECFLNPTETSGEPEHFSSIRRALVELHPKVEGSPGSWAQRTPPFGYQDTGALFCKYDNCPDNSVPVVHHKSDLGWEPLFYRVSREEI